MVNLAKLADRLSDKLANNSDNLSDNLSNVLDNLSTPYLENGKETVMNGARTNGDINGAKAPSVPSINIALS